MKKHTLYPLYVTLFLIFVAGALAYPFYRFAAMTPEQHVERGLEALSKEKSYIAYRHLLSAAQNGCVDGQYHLAILLMRGDEDPKNRADALSWMMKAADAGNPNAQYIAGVWLEQEYPDKAKEALKLYEKAAAQGQTNAMRSLILIYGETDREKSEEWYRKLKKEMKDKK